MKLDPLSAYAGLDHNGQSLTSDFVAHQSKPASACHEFVAIIDRSPLPDCNTRPNSSMTEECAARSSAVASELIATQPDRQPRSESENYPYSSSRNFPIQLPIVQYDICAHESRDPHAWKAWPRDPREPDFIPQSHPIEFRVLAKRPIVRATNPEPHLP